MYLSLDTAINTETLQQMLALKVDDIVISDGIKCRVTAVVQDSIVLEPIAE